MILHCLTTLSKLHPTLNLNDQGSQDTQCTTQCMTTSYGWKSSVTLCFKDMLQVCYRTFITRNANILHQKIIHINCLYKIENFPRHTKQVTVRTIQSMQPDKI